MQMSELTMSYVRAKKLKFSKFHVQTMEKIEAMTSSTLIFIFKSTVQEIFC